jgi:hypothetical protein
MIDPTRDLSEHPSPGRALFVRSVSAGDDDNSNECGKEAAEGKGASKEELGSYLAEAAAVRRALIVGKGEGTVEGKGEGKDSDSSASDDGWSSDDDSTLSSGSTSSSDVASDEWDARDSSGSHQRPRFGVCCPERHPLVRVQAACAAGKWAILCERISTAEDSEGLIEALEDIDMLVRRSRGGWG